MARITLISVTDKPSHNREHKARHHDHDRELPGWAKHREPLIERPAVNRNIGDVGRWTARASKHSGEQFAPGTGGRRYNAK
jgi:hypothetical protein